MCFYHHCESCAGSFMLTSCIQLLDATILQCVCLMIECRSSTLLPGPTALCSILCELCMQFPLHKRIKQLVWFWLIVLQDLSEHDKTCAVYNAAFNCLFPPDFPAQEDWTSSLMYVDCSSGCIVDDCKNTKESILLFLSLPTIFVHHTLYSVIAHRS